MWHFALVGTIPVLHPIQWPPLVPAVLNDVAGRKGLEDLWDLLGWEFHMWAFRTCAGWAGLLTNHCYNFHFRGYLVKVLCDNHSSAHPWRSLPGSDLGHRDAHTGHTLEVILEKGGKIHQEWAYRDCAELVVGMGCGLGREGGTLVTVPPQSL